MTDDILSLPQIVETAFRNAVARPDIARWKSVSMMAGCAAIRFAADGDLFQAACMEGVADESRHQMMLLMPKEAPCHL